MQDIYCELIIPGKLKVDKIYESENVWAFYHTKPYWEYHAVIIPTNHITSITDLEENVQLYIEFFKAIKVVAKLFEDNFGGCRISSNVGSYQSSKHLHWYIHAGQRIADKPIDPHS